MPDSRPRSGALVMRARMCCIALAQLLTVWSNRLLNGLEARIGGIYHPVEAE